MVWMRASPTSKVRKLWAKVDRPVLEKGRYRIQIENTWDAGPYKSEKWVIISQVNAFGGKNSIIGNAFITVGSISVFLMILMAVRKLIRPKGVLYSHINSLRRNNNIS